MSAQTLAFEKLDEAFNVTNQYTKKINSNVLKLPDLAKMSAEWTKLQNIQNLLKDATLVSKISTILSALNLGFDVGTAISQAEQFAITNINIREGNINANETNEFLKKNLAGYIYTIGQRPVGSKANLFDMTNLLTNNVNGFKEPINQTLGNTTEIKSDLRTLSGNTTNRFNTQEDLLQQIIAQIKEQTQKQSNAQISELQKQISELKSLITQNNASTEKISTELQKQGVAQSQIATTTKAISTQATETKALTQKVLTQQATTTQAETLKSDTTIIKQKLDTVQNSVNNSSTQINQKLDNQVNNNNNNNTQVNQKLDNLNNSVQTVNDKTMDCEQLKDCLGNTSSSSELEPVDLFYTVCEIDKEGEHKPKKEIKTFIAKKGEITNDDKKKFDDSAELAKIGCDPITPIASVPEHWQLRAEAGRPQLVIIYREKKSNGKIGIGPYSVTIPHFNGNKASLNPPKYKKGQWEAIATLEDNSKIIVNAANAQEAEKVLNQLKAYSTKKVLNVKIGQRKGFELKTVDVVPIRADYYEGGQKSVKSWSKYFTS